MQLGPTELIIILVIVIVLFGVGRISRLGGEVGSAVANFRRGLNEGKDTANPTQPTSTSENTPS